MSPDVTVVGAGISGLAVAYALSRRGWNVLVLEREMRIGGKAISEDIGGFLMEHGPSAVNGTSPAALELCRDLELDGERVELGPEVKHRYLTAAGSLHGIATHPLGFLTSGYLSWHGRLRMLGEVAVPGSSACEEETVAEFCARRFGREFAERVMDPLVGGMFAGDARKLSIASVFPALREMERRHGSVIRALVHGRLRGGRMPGRRLLSWRRGVGSLPHALARGLASSVRTGVVVRRIRGTAWGFRIETGAHGAIGTRAVVIATPAHLAAALLADLDARSAAAAAAIEAPPLATVFLGYERRQVAHPLDGIGYLTPSGEERAVTGALFCSTMFPQRAPEGCVALSAYLGGARVLDLARRPHHALLAEAESEFAELLGAKGRPVVAKVRVWPHGLPQYYVRHSALAAELASAPDRIHGLFLVGNYLNGVSVAACLAQAAESAGRISNFLLKADKTRSRPDRSAIAGRGVSAPLAIAHEPMEC